METNNNIYFTEEDFYAINDARKIILNVLTKINDKENSIGLDVKEQVFKQRLTIILEQIEKILVAISSDLNIEQE